MAQNALLRLVVKQTPDKWERAGRPSVIFSPPRGAFFRYGVPGEWVLSPPPWLKAIPNVSALLRWLRVGYLLLLCGLGAIFVVVAGLS